MIKKRITYQWCIALLLCFMQTAGIAMYGQDSPRAAAKRNIKHQLEDSLQVRSKQPSTDSLAVVDSIATENKRKMLEMTSGTAPAVQLASTDSLQNALNKKIWIPNPVKATWLALVLPGAGQIYNRKFWKLPIIYGGFAGCAYALSWNGKMYKDYMQAYKDAINKKWNSSSITDLLPPGYINKVSKDQLTDILRRRKDTYRRYRDLSIFAFIGVYLISVVDAYVDAELSNFDITPDLSMKIEPTVISNQQFKTSDKSVGVQCSFRF